ASPDTATAVATGTARSTASGTGAATNVGDGDNFLTARQVAPASTGDAVGGQVIGAVTAGRSSIDARNSSVDSSVTSGDARSANDSNAFVGLQSNGIGNASSTAAVRNAASALTLGFGSFDTASSLATSGGGATSTSGALGAASNDQTGVNRATVSQNAPASSGDAVGGEVVGAV